MSSESIPMDWVEGAEETTVWFWPNAPDTVTTRFDRDEWAQIKEQADGDVAGYITDVIVSDLRENPGILAD